MDVVWSRERGGRVAAHRSYEFSVARTESTVQYHPPARRICGKVPHAWDTWYHARVRCVELRTGQPRTTPMNGRGTRMAASQTCTSCASTVTASTSRSGRTPTENVFKSQYQRLARESQSGRQGRGPAPERRWPLCCSTSTSTHRQRVRRQLFGRSRPRHFDTGDVTVKPRKSLRETGVLSRCCAQQLDCGAVDPERGPPVLKRGRSR